MARSKKQAAEPLVRVSGPGEGARGNREVPPTTDAGAQKPVPFWRKEISLRRGAKVDAAAEEPIVVEEMVETPAQKKPSIWKRELSVGRKAKNPEPEAAVEEAPVADVEEPAEKKLPIWKREVSLGRKRKKSEAFAEEVEPAEEEGSWRRDLIFGATEAEPAEPEAEQATEPEPLPAPVFFELPPNAESGTDFAAAADDDSEPDAIDPPPSWAAPAVASLSTAYGWLTDDVAAADLASTSWAGTQPPVLPEPPKRTPAPDPDPVQEAEPQAEVAVEEQPESIFDAPRLETVAPSLPRVEIHPPVTAAELPPLPERAREKKPSLLKRELSFRRKPKEQAEADAPAGVPAEDAAVAPEEKTSPLKREISFRRKPKADADERQAAKVTKERKPKRRHRDRDAEEAVEPTPAQEKRRGKGAKAAKGGRHKKLVGLKIGASQLAAARVHNNGSAQLLQLARGDLDAGVVVGGELRDPEALATALRAFFKEHKLPKTGVRLGIANNRIGVRIFDLAGIEDPKQLANAIRFRAQEALPIPIEEAVLDYRVLGETRDEDGGTSRRILLVVAYRDLVDRYVDACAKAGIKLVGIDLEAFALLRALSTPPEDENDVPDSATVAVAVGHERSTFAVSNGRVCEFTRVLEWGGASLNVAIARALDLSPSEAEPIKRELSLAAETEIDGLNADQVVRAREALLRQVQGFARELVSSLQFYQGQPGSLGIAEIAVTGGTAHLPGLAAELERLIGVRVSVGDPLARVRVGKEIGDEDQIGSLAVAIGLGIDD